MGMPTGTATWEDWQFLTKQIILSPCDPAIVPISIYTKELKTCPHKNKHINVYRFIHDAKI
jgi:hypothetical protein